MLKVLFITHQMGVNFRGGAESQMQKTLQYINSSSEKYHVKLYNMWEDKIENFDIVHIFNPIIFPYESNLISKYAKTKGIKVVISPIFYPKPVGDSINSRIQHTVEESYLYLRKIPLMRKLFQNRLFSHLDPLRSRESSLKNSDILLPNTVEEYSKLCKYFNIDDVKFQIVPNGVDIDFKYGDPKLFTNKYNIDNFILFVGRIEPRKNILKLINAFVKSKLEAKLVVIGQVKDNEYYKSCIEHSNENVFFLPPVEHESEILKSAYKAAKVVILPSDYETPGLVALEGGISGANLVVTNVGGTKQYFGEYALYVDPSNENDIHDKLIASYYSTKTNKLSEHIEHNFLWNNVAKKTIDAYDIIIN